MKFAADFDLSSSVILSTIELGDIFLSSIKNVSVRLREAVVAHSRELALTSLPFPHPHPPTHLHPPAPLSTT